MMNIWVHITVQRPFDGSILSRVININDIKRKIALISLFKNA